MKHSPQFLRCLVVLICLLLMFSPGKKGVAADAGWPYVEQVDLFTVHSQFSLKPIRGALGDLKTLRRDIEKQLGITVKKENVSVYLFATQKGYRNYIGKRIPRAVNRRALYVKGPAGARIYAYQQRLLGTDLRHEATHALLHNALPYIPLWLDEGLAEYFEVPLKYRFAGNPHLKTTLAMIPKGWQPSLRQLEAKATLAEMKGDDYRHAWAWIHFLIHGPKEVNQAFRVGLQDIIALKPPTPLSKSLALKNHNLEASLKNHILSIRKRSLK